MLGTNPLTLAAPGRGNDSFVLDMATSGVAVGKVTLTHTSCCSHGNTWHYFTVKISFLSEYFLFAKFSA